jgi:hypothetical protein
MERVARRMRGSQADAAERCQDAFIWEFFMIV